LRLKLLLVLGSALLVIALAFHAIAAHWLMDGFLRIEREALLAARHDSAEALEAGAGDLAAQLSDWSQCDDAYAFMESHDPVNLQSSLLRSRIAQLQVDAVLYIDSAATLRAAFCMDPQTATIQPLGDSLRAWVEQHAAALGGGSDRPLVAGMVRLSEGPALLASRPIVRTDGSGPARGRLVFVRRLDPTELAHIARRSGPSLELLPLTEREAWSSIDTQAAGSIHALGPEHGLDFHVSDRSQCSYYLVADLLGEPTWLARLSGDRPIWLEGRASVHSMTKALIGVGVIFGVLSMLFLERVVLTRLLRIEQSLADIHGGARTGARVPEEGADELASLGRGINAVLEHSAAVGIELRRREAESRKLALLASRTDNMALICDADGRVQWVNGAFERQTGYTLEAAVGRAPDELLQGSSHESRVQDALDAGHGYAGTLCCRRQDGKAYWAELEIQPVVEEDNGQHCYIGLARDVTSRLEVEQELLAAKELAESAARAKSDFLANMSHEIRTPMTAIIGFADLLADPHVSPLERVGHVQTIRRNGQHLLAIINDILDISKIEAGKLTLERIPYDPRQVVEDVLSMCRPRAVENGLTLNSDITQSTCRNVLGDPTRLRQVLMNLVSNAVKFTASGGVSVRLAVTNVDATTCKLHFEIADTGLGMSAEQLANLFKAFSQADTSMTRRYGGTGLGLAISQRLTEAMGGVLRVTSKPNEGSTFRFELAAPIAQSEAQPLRSASPIAAPVLIELPRLDGMRILLAEDGIDNQRLIRSVLSRQGAAVELAENGRIALQRCCEALKRNEIYDVVLMDMQMPELDGYGATMNLRQLGYDGPIVALTAHAMEGDRQRCLTAGCDDYATKPIQRPLLIPLISRWRGRRSERCAA
jgi:PAS domain S-box-containing protein